MIKMQYVIIKIEVHALEEAVILVLKEIQLKKINYILINLVMTIKEILMLYQNINSNNLKALEYEVFQVIFY